MTTKNVKNILYCIGFITTIICISAVPYMCKWLLGAYIVYLFSIWLGDDKDHEQVVLFIIPKLHASMTFIYFTLYSVYDIIIIENESRIK